LVSERGSKVAIMLLSVPVDYLLQARARCDRV
jgi:hypothetical protein